MKIYPTAALVLSALMTTLASQAAEPRGVSAELTVWQVPASSKGRPLTNRAEQVKPGDVLEYQARYVNTSQQATRQLVATLPIPSAGMVFLPGSASPEGATASTDGRHFDALPLKRWVVLPDGRREQRLVSPQEYRALRWDLGELAPGQQRQVSARMKVDDAAPVATAVNATTVPGSTR
jgi:hypothetical protein